MTPKLGHLFFLETGTALQRKTLHILKKIHTGVILFQVSVKDKIINIEKIIGKRESRIQELIKGQDLTKKDEGDRKQALKTCVNKRENEKKNFPKDVFEHHDQELELNIRTKYGNETEKDVPDEKSTLSKKGVSLNQTNQNVCAARDDEHQAISKKENTLLSEHLQKEEQSFESRLNEDISSSVDQKNDSIIDVGGCEKKEDQDSTEQQTNSLINVEPPATQATETVEKVTSKIEIGREGGGCDNKDDLGSTLLQTNLLTYVELLAALEKKTYGQQTVSKEVITSLSKLILRKELSSKEMCLPLKQFIESLEGGDFDNKDDLVSTLLQTNFLTSIELLEKPMKTCGRQTISQEEKISLLKPIQRKEPSLVEVFLLSEQNIEFILEAGDYGKKEDQGSTVPQTNSLTDVEPPAAQAMATVEPRAISKIETTPVFQLQKYELPHEPYFDISSSVDQNNDSFPESDGCDHKFDQDSTVLQTNSPRYVVPPATQAGETDRGTFQCRLKPLTMIRQEYHQNSNVNAFNAQSGRRFKGSNNSINDFGQSAKIAETSSKENCVDYKEYMPRRVFISVKRKKIKCLGKKSERRYVLVQGLSNQEFGQAANNPQFESIFNLFSKIPEIINSELPDDGERLAQDSEIDTDEEVFYILEQDGEEKAIQDKDKKVPVYRLNVVTAEVFENAMRQYQIENYEITHTNYFPSNCRMFLHIPVLKGGFINRRDMKNRR